MISGGGLMAYEQILTGVSGRLGLIRMNRPDKLNAVTGQMDHEIRQRTEAHWEALTAFRERRPPRFHLVSNHNEH